MRRLFFILERSVLAALFAGGVVAVIAFADVIVSGGAQPAQVAIVEPVTEAASAATPVIAPVNVPALGEMITVCHSVSGAAALTLCLRSDGSGSMTVANGAQTSEYVYAFYDDVDDCPNAPEGFVTHNRHMTTRDLADFGFTQADIDTLGLPGRYCAFSAATF